MNRRMGRESGQVSIITVIIFILLFSVLVISFSRIMVTVSRQTTNDELAASAKAAAESGIEDAKRILSYCMTGGVTGCAFLDKPIDDSSITCTTISSSTGLMSALQLSPSSDSVVAVGNTGNQSYLCLKATMITPDYLGSLSSNGNTDGLSESEVIPLNFVDKSNPDVPVSPATIQIQWHNTGSDSDGAATVLDGSALPTADNWGKTVPAVLRVEFVAVPKSSFTISQLAANVRSVTLRPSTAWGDPNSNLNNGSDSGIPAKFAASIGTAPISGGTISYNVYNLDSWIVKGGQDANAAPNYVNPTVFLLPVQCAKDTPYTGYSCGVVFKIPKIPGSGSTDYLFDTTPTGYDYYLRLQAVYQNTHFRVSAKDPSGKDLFFKDVQADVDVTGRATDSQKRLNVRLNPNNGKEDYQWWPDYAIDSAGRVCKDMTILNNSGTDNCKDK